MGRTRLRIVSATLAIWNGSIGAWLSLMTGYVFQRDVFCDVNLRGSRGDTGLEQGSAASIG